MAEDKDELRPDSDEAPVEEEDDQEVEEDEVEPGAMAANPDLDKFLGKWDREIDPEKRVFGTKILFAGAESQTFRDGLYRVGVRHILISYFYMQNWLRKRSLQEISDDLGRFDFVFLDSGGFTFLEGERTGKKMKYDIKTYTDKFYEEIKRYGHLFAGIAEVDLPQKLGWDYLEQQRRECKDAGLQMLPIIQGEPLEKYEDLGWFEQYPYIGMGSKLFAPKYTGYRTRMFAMARKHGCVIHGLAGTGVKKIQRSQFYSVDSTSWLGGGRFGTTMIFQNGRLRHYDMTKKDVRKRYKRRFEENGLIWSEIEADTAIEINLMNSLAWKQWSDYIKYSGSKCYWLTDEEKETAKAAKAKMFNTEGIIDRGTSIRRAEHRRLNIATDFDFDDRAHETLHCDSCQFESRCPRYKPKNPCGYDINIRMTSKQDIARAQQMMLEIQHGRVMTGVLFEKLEGGVLDRNLSQEVSTYMSMLQQVRGTYDAPQDEVSIKVRAKGGGLQAALAGVFASTGAGNSGSGNSQVQRHANALPAETGAEVIEAVPEPANTRLNPD